MIRKILQEIRASFFELLGDVSINEYQKNSKIYPVIDRLDRMLKAAL